MYVAHEMHGLILALLMSGASGVRKPSLNYPLYTADIKQSTPGKVSATDVAIQTAMATVMSERPRKIRIGDMLVNEGVITPEQLVQALAEQKQTGRKLGRVLVESGYLSEERLLHLLAQQLNVPYVDLRRYPYDADVVRLIPETHARRFRAIALEDKDGSLLVGMADPTNLFGYDELARVLRRSLRLAVVRESDLLATIDRIYRRTEEISGLAAELEQEVAANDIALGALEINESQADAPVVRLIQSMFEDAVQVQASDIHIEPDEKELRIRFRLDGILRIQTTADRRIASALVSRLKLMTGLDISERRLPQDGRCQVRVRDHVVDVRVSTIPVQHGESVVMRLLDQSAGLLDLSGIGMDDVSLLRFRDLIRAPHGMVLVTGPTGSGKTTTLYAALRELNRPETKILTVEDPVEYRLPGISQVQVNTKIDLGFARVLRSLLRQDPDVILVGEMRDDETVEIGLRAAMTGHLVLSTVHTNDAVSTAMRLRDMGAESYVIAASLRGIVAQRLMRRVCESCAEPASLSAEQQLLVEAELGEAAATATFMRGQGCTHCNSTGYQGRLPVFEVLTMNESLVRALQANDAGAFADAARRQAGHQSLRHAAVRLAARGLTTLDQVVRATYGMNGGEA